MAAAVQRKAIEDELQRFTLRVTRRTVPIIFSMMLVQASERRNCAGRPSLLTVRISSNPSRMLFETPGASRSRRWARLRISFSAFAASSSSQAWRNARRTEACRAGDRRSMMFRALWIWQRWIGAWRPKLRRIALASAFEPSMINKRGTAGSRPRSIRSSINACTTALCSVAPSISPSGCLNPSLSIPSAATSTRCSLMWMPSICTTMMSRPDRSAPIHSLMRAADNATKCREAADFDTPAGAGVSKTAASRHFVALSAARMQEWMGADLSGLDIMVVQIDGIHISEHLVLVAALGIDSEGFKHPLGLMEGATEHSAVVQALIDDLIERGLDPAVPRLFIIDGSKALAKAIRRSFGRHAPIQRCQIHKARNIMERLSPALHASVRRALRQAWELDDAAKAEKLIRNLAQRLERDAPGVSKSIREGLDEILTVSRLGLPAQLRRSLACTNIIENMMGTVRRVTRNVKRWSCLLYT